MAKLAQRKGLNLANALPGQVEPRPDLFEGPGVAPVQAEAETQHLSLPRAQRSEQDEKFGSEYRSDRLIGRIDCSLVFDEVVQGNPRVFAERLRD